MFHLSRQKTSLIIQVMQSGVSLLLALAIMPILGTTGFGFFSISLSVQLFVLGAVDAGLLTPLIVKSGSYQNEVSVAYFRRRIVCVFLFAVILSIISILIFPLIATFNNQLPANIIFLAGATAFAAFVLVLRELARAFFLFSGRFRFLLILEFAVSLVTLLGVGLISLAWKHAAEVEHIVMIIGAVNALYALIALSVMPMKIMRFKNAAKRLLTQLNEGYVSLAAAKVTWLQSQSYTYFLAAMASISAVGVLSATRLLYSPLQTVFAGISRGILPDLVQQISRRNFGDFSKSVRKSYLYFGLLVSIWTLAGLVLFPQLFRFIGASDFNPEMDILIGWGCVFLLTGFRSISSVAIKALGRFDLLLKQGIVGAVIAVIAIPILISSHGFIGALIALSIAEGIAFLISLKFVSSSLAARHV